MNDIIRFQVPCKLKYTKLVEEITRQISSYVEHAENPKLAQNLRAVMNEVFINIVKHSQTSQQEEMVRFQFELGLDYFTISIYDNGPGFEADGARPPYPKHVIGKKFKLREVYDGIVYFTIVNPFEVTFEFEARPEEEMETLDQLAFLEDHGLGISIVTKLMDNVSYTYIGQGKFDWKLVKKLK